MKRTTVWLVVVLGMALALNGCSSSKKSDLAQSQDEIPTLDAGTDALPADPAATDPATSPEATPQAESSVPTETPAEPEFNPMDEKVAAAPESPAPLPAAEPVPPAEPDAPLAPPVAPPVAASSGENDHYTVQPGDTLMRIAFETYGDLYQWKKVYEMNRDQLPSPTALKKGMVLKIEKPAVPVTIERNGEKYLIKLGDTLGKISDDVYGTPKKWRKLYENNKQMIRDPNRIFAGFFLYYTLTEEERQDAERMKSGRQRTPIADSQTAEPAAEQQAEPAQNAPAAAPGFSETAQSGVNAGGGIRMPSSNP